jgi:iron complex transport system substrate-binding protein
MHHTTRAIGRLVARADAAAAVLERFDAALAAATPPAGVAPVQVLFVYDVQPGFVFTTGGGDHISELVTRLGAVNVADGPVTIRLGLERVLAAGPELILHVAPDQRFPTSAAAFAYWSSWPELPATRARQVVVFPDDRLARNGPHLAGVVPTLAAIVAAARQARRARTP